MNRITSWVLCFVLIIASITTQPFCFPERIVQAQAKVVTSKESKAINTDESTDHQFKSLKDPNLSRYLEDAVYDELVETLGDSNYFVENVSTVYVSKEYIEELEYNSRANVFFGYNLKDLDAQFKGTKYVFTLGNNGKTEVIPFEKYDDTYEKALKDVAIGSGVILMCVTVSVVTGGTAPAVSMIFAVSAKTGTIAALSTGTISGMAAGIVTGIQTKDFDKAKKAAASEGGRAFKLAAITGALAGGTSEAIALHGATLKGLTMNEAAAIQKESKYPLDVIKQFHSKKEYEVFKNAKLKPVMVNDKTALVRNDIKLDLVDEFGRTNLQRMKAGLSPLDANGSTYELHHIGQEADATLAILTQTEHDNAVLHGFKAISEIDRKAFSVTRKEFWKTMAVLLEKGSI